MNYIIPHPPDQPKNAIFNPTFSFFAGVKNPAPHDRYDLTQIVGGVRQNAGWKATTERLRKLKSQDEDKYKALKEKAFAFTPSGVFSYRNNQSLNTHALVMSLDFDGFTMTDEAIAFRDQLARLPETTLAFISPSGLGVKVLIRLHSPTTEANHHSAWRAVKDFTEKVRGFDVPPDKFAKDISRLCFISHDPDAYHNPKPAAFDWKAYLNDNPHLRQDETRNSEPLEPSVFQYDGGDIPQWLPDALSYLDADDYEVWLAVGSALKHGEFPFELWAEWSQTSDKYKESEARYKWEKGFNRIPFDYIPKSAQREGWTPPWGKQRAKTVLKPEPIPTPTRGWQEQQAELEQAFDSEHDTVLIKADTGVGKDYAKVSYIIQTDPDAQRFVEMVPRIELGDEKTTDFQQRQKEHDEHRSVYQWRSVFYNSDNSLPFHIRKTLIGERLMCIQPSKFEALRAKGASPQTVLCPSCPVYDVCRQKGYLSQTKIAQHADYLITAQDGVFFDKSIAGFAKRVIHDSQRTVTGIVDEVRAHELYQECVLTKSELQMMGQNWEGTPAGEFAIAIIDALEHGTQPDYLKVQHLIENLSETETRTITAAFTKIRIHGRADFDDDSKIYEGELMLASGTFYPKTGKAVAIAVSEEALDIFKEMRVPAVFRREIDTNVLTISYHQAIQFGFYEIPADDDTTPINDFPKLHRNQHWTPLHQLQQLFEQYPRIEDTPIHYNGESLSFYLPPEIHPSLDKIIMMSATAETELIKDKVFTDREVQVIEAEPARWLDGNEVFQVRTGKYPRATVKDKDDNLKGFGQRAWDTVCAEIEGSPDKTHAVITYKSLVDKLKLPPNAIIAHYGATEGENDRFKDCSCFWILFDQCLPPDDVEMRAKTIFGRDDSPLNYEYDKEKGVYVDERLQRVADHYAIEQLTQAIGRARLVRRTGVKVVIMTGRELPGISGRNETTLFDLEDLIIADGLDKLSEIVRKREQSEAEQIAQIQKMIEDGASDNQIRNELGIHPRRLAAIRETFPAPKPASTQHSGGMSQVIPPAIRAPIVGGMDVTKQIQALIYSGLRGAKDIYDRLNESHSLSPAAIRQRLARMVRSGKLIRTERGVYALPNAGCDFLPPLEAENELIPRLTPAYLPLGLDISELFRRVTQDVWRGRDDEAAFAVLEPPDIPRLMRSHVDELGVPPFVPTAKALDAVVEYRGARLQRLAFDILYDPEKYEELVGPFIDRFVGNRGRADPSNGGIAFLLSLRTWEGESWGESLVPKVQLKHSLVSLFRRERSAESCLTDIHGNWNFACLNEALVKHPLVPFVEFGTGLAEGGT